VESGEWRAEGRNNRMQIRGLEEAPLSTLNPPPFPSGISGWELLKVELARPDGELVKSEK